MSRPDVISPRREALLQEAADWLVRLDAGELSPPEQQALQNWHQTSPEHERVWRMACELNREFSSVPADLAGPVLGRQRLNRRAVLKSLAGAGLLLPLSWTVVRSKPWQPLLAEYQTAAGEQRSITLTDGSELTLNTDTAMDVLVDSHQRLIRLYRGEIYILTGKDRSRDFTVATDQGGIRALGTEFAVRCLTNATEVTVTRDAVVVAPASSISPQQVGQGQQCRFTPTAIESIQNAPDDSLAWRRGELIVDNWKLEIFVAELARYRPGLLRCDSAVADLRVSGVFQTANTDQALEALARVHNLRVTRFTDYWVSIGAADTG